MATDETQLDQNSTETQSTEETPSLRDTLKENYSEIASRDDDTQEEETETETEDQETGQETEDEEQELREELQSEQTDEELEEFEDGTSGDEETDTEGQDTRESLQVSEDLQNTFDYLPKETREHLEEAGYDEDTLNQFLTLVKGQNDKYIQKTQQYSELVKVVEPFGEALALQGITPAQKLKQYIAWEQGIAKNPLEGMIQLGRSLGFDLVKMISDKQSSEEQTFEDPAQKEINDLRTRIDAQDQKALEELNARLLEQVEQFKNAKAEDGTLKYPHFEKVRKYMGPHIEAGKDLESAYNAIVEELELGMPSQSSETRKPRKNIKKAKKLSTKVKSSKSSSKVTEKPGSLRDELKANAKKLNIGR